MLTEWARVMGKHIYIDSSSNHQAQSSPRPMGSKHAPILFSFVHINSGLLYSLEKWIVCELQFMYDHTNRYWVCREDEDALRT